MEERERESPHESCLKISHIPPGGVITNTYMYVEKLDLLQYIP